MSKILYLMIGQHIIKLAITSYIFPPFLYCFINIYSKILPLCNLF